MLTAVSLALIASWIASGQTHTISTLAGGGTRVGVPGTSVSLHPPHSVAVDKAGNVFFADGDSVMRLDAATGVLTLVAGNGTGGFGGDNGPATEAQLTMPRGVAVDSKGNVYIAASGRVRKVANGVITTVAGGGSGPGDDGPATSAQLNEPLGVAVDSEGNLYIADSGNNLIRKVSNGAIATVAGNTAAGYSGDNGPAANAQLSRPSGVAVDSEGNLYIADTDNNRVRKISNGVITTVAGNGTRGDSGDNGPAALAKLDRPKSVAVDSAGNLYIADIGAVTGRVRKVANGTITTVAGGGGHLDDGSPATSAWLSQPDGVAVDSAGNIYIADTLHQIVRKVSNGLIATVAGNNTPGSSGPAASAQLYYPTGVAADRAGNVYVADTSNNRVRKISNGVIASVAGGGVRLDENCPATSADLHSPTQVAVDSAGNVYVNDIFYAILVRRVAGGVIATVAGDLSRFGDSTPATRARLHNPRGIAVDSTGAVYIADAKDNLVYKVSNGAIATVAGNGTPGFSGDNGPASGAQLNGPWGLAVDSAGSLYIADWGNNRIRKVSNGTITTVAGNGTQGFSGDNGPATSTQLNRPAGIAVDPAGNLYIADTGNNRIRQVSNGAIATIAGNGTTGLSGDGGPATSAQLHSPTGIAVDSAGNVYVADTGNDRIRLLTPGTPATAPHDGDRPRP
jgi:sugar lactone lactonase YvrE